MDESREAAALYQYHEQSLHPNSSQYLNITTPARAGSILSIPTTCPHLSVANAPLITKLTLLPNTPSYFSLTTGFKCGTLMIVSRYSQSSSC
jgi:hypothetical protein